MLSLGNINFGLGVDTTNLVASIGRIVRFGDEVERAARRTGDGAAVAAAALRRQEAAALSALNATLNLYSRIQAQAPAATALIQETERAFGRLAQGMTAGRATSLSFQRSMEAFRTETGNVQRSLDLMRNSQSAFFSQTREGSAHLIQMNRHLRDLGNIRPTGVSGWVDWFKNVASAATLTFGPLSGAGSRILAFTSILGRSSALVTGFVVAAGTMSYVLSKISIEAVKTAIAMQTVNSRLLAVSGSQAIVNLQLGNLSKLADQTGISFIDLATGFSSFQAAAQGTSLSAQKVADVFRDVSIAAAKFNLPAEQTRSVFLALEQMLSKGTVSMQELRQQLGNALPGAFAMAAKAAGVTTRELMKLVETGNLAADTFVPKLAQAMREASGADVNTRIDTLIASYGRLQSAVTHFLVAFDNLFRVSILYKAALDGLTGSINAFTAAMNAISGNDPFKASIKSIQDYIVALSDGRAINIQMTRELLVSNQALIVDMDLMIHKQQEYVAALEETAKMYGIAATAGNLDKQKARLDEMKIDLQQLRTLSDVLNKTLTDAKTQDDAVAASARTDQQLKAIDAVKEQIRYNNLLGQAMQKSRMDGEAMQRTLEDTKAYEQAADGLTQAKIAGEEFDEILRGLAGSLATKKLGEFAVALEQISRETAQNFAQANAGMSGTTSGLGKAFQEALTVEQDLANQHLDTLTKLNALSNGSKAAKEAADKYIASLRANLEVEKELALVEANRTVGRNEKQAQALEALANQHIQASDALAGLNKEFEREDARNKFIADLVRINVSAEEAGKVWDRNAGYLNRIQTQMDGFELDRVDEEINRLNQYADALGRNADEAAQLREKFDIEDQVSAARSTVYGLTNDIGRAVETSERLRRALNNVAESEVRMRGLQAAVRGLADIGQSALESLFRGGKNFKQILGVILQDIAMLIAKLTIINPLMNSITGAKGQNALPVVGGFGALLGGALGGLGSLFGGGSAATSFAGNAIAPDFGNLAFAASGLEGVRPGQPVVVGDGGEPEIFIPNQVGDIVPFSKLGRGSNRDQGPVRLEVMIGAGPEFAPTVRQIAGPQTQMMISTYDKQSLPTRVNKIAQRPRAR